MSQPFHTRMVPAAPRTSRGHIPRRDHPDRSRPPSHGDVMSDLADTIRQRVRPDRLARGLIVEWTRPDGATVENSYATESERDAFLAQARRKGYPHRIVS